MNQLEPCPHCERHVRTTETSCPFCGAAIAAAMRAVRPRQLPRTRLSRAALLAFGLGVAASSLTGCADESDDGSGRGDDSDDDDDDDGRVTPVYGAPVQPRDAAVDASGEKLDAGRDAASEAGAATDAAASDARTADAASADAAAADGGVDAGRRFDAGSVVALYGLPPAPPRDHGDVAVPIYGAPVPKPPAS